LFMYYELRLGSEVAVSLSPVHGFGSVYQRFYASPTPNWLNLNDC